jgi:hypothetical protein
MHTSSVVLLVDKENKLAIARKAFNSNSFAVQSLAMLPYNKKDGWHMTLLPLGSHSYVLPYSTKGGMFSSIETDGSLSVLVKLPVFPGVVR